MRRRPRRGATAVLLCVPDEAIEPACEAVAGADPLPALVGHVSGAGTLAALEPAFAAGAATFSLHPLQTFPDGATAVEGTPAAVAGSDDARRVLRARAGRAPRDAAVRRARGAARRLPRRRLHGLELPGGAAGGVGRAAGPRGCRRSGRTEARELLAPLVLRTAANWAERGPDALTGPIARGDRATVERHRAALAELSPELLDAYEALAAHTEAISSGRSKEVPA